jgi:hypothetical protein
MATTLAENLEISNRYLRINAKNDDPRYAGGVYLAIPCEHAHHGEHAIGIERADFIRAIANELGLVDPLEQLFAL